MNERIDIIMSRYFCGEASKKELQFLDDWIAQSKENEKQFQQMTLLYQHAGQKNVLEVDTEQAWGKFNNHIHEKQNNRTIFNISNTYKYAAAIALLLIATCTLLFFAHYSSKTIHLVAATEVSKEYEIFENANVTLFQGAEIIYNQKKNNELKLKGKATFTVHSKENKEAQIIVQAGETFIKDVGTVFTVDATHPDKYISVDVSEGEVWFYTTPHTGVNVKANEFAIYNVQNKQFTIGETDNYPSLPDIVFQNIPLYEVIDALKLRYGVDIFINSETLNKIFLNVSFDKDESVENVLDIIAATIGAQFSKKENAYIITAQ